jgi:hypothetical protein
MRMFRALISRPLALEGSPLARRMPMVPELVRLAGSVLIGVNPIPTGPLRWRP